MYYASIGIISLIMHIIINLDYLKWYSKEDYARLRLSYKRYRVFLFSIAIYYLTDILWGLLYDAGLTAATYIDTIAYFLAMVTTVLLWTRTMVIYLGRRGPLTTAFITGGWMIFVFEVVSLLINIFIPIVFGFDSEGVYSTYTGRTITLVLQLALYFLTSIYAFVVALNSDGNVSKHHRTIALSGSIMALFIALQCQFPLMPFYTVGCLIATTIIHSFVTIDENLERQRLLGQVRQIAYQDALTGVNSVHAYVEVREKIDRRMYSGQVQEFAIVVFDLNGLKTVNDNLGHEEGDRYIISGCRIISKSFPHSEVYRIGGDEFVAILEGEDYRRREELIRAFESRMDENRSKNLVSISSGLAVYNPGADNDFNTVFERADRKMYDRKKQMKAAF